MAKAVYNQYMNETGVAFSITQYPTRTLFSGSEETYYGYSFDEASGNFSPVGSPTGVRLDDSFQAASGKNYYFFPSGTAHAVYQVLSFSSLDSVEQKYLFSVLNITAQGYPADVKGEYIGQVILDYGSVETGVKNPDGYWYELERKLHTMQVISSGVAVEGTVRIIDRGVSKPEAGLYVIENGVAVEGG